MARKVVWSDESIADFAALVSYITADRPVAAERFGQTILGATRKLAEFPQADRIVPEVGNSNVREIIVEPYRVIYEVNPSGQTLAIVRVWHAARGMPGI
jgi:toxin ParE1/3/4